MSLYRQAGSKVFWYDFHFDGQRIRESTKTTNIERARKMERKRRQKLEENTASIQKPERPKLFSTAAEAWMEAKKPKWSPRMYGIAENSMKHLAPAFGKKLVVDIEARDIARYQKERLAK
jgi:hypothetical protein